MDKNCPSWFSRLFVLVYRILLIKSRQKISTAFEILFPVVFALFLIIPRKSSPPVFFSSSYWTTPEQPKHVSNTSTSFDYDSHLHHNHFSQPSFNRSVYHNTSNLFSDLSSSNSSNPFNQDNNDEELPPLSFRRCPFGFYGPLALGPFTHEIVNELTSGAKGDVVPLLKALGNEPDVPNLACNQTYIPRSPYFRPLILYPRTFDGKHLSYLPILIHGFGPIVIVSRIFESAYVPQAYSSNPKIPDPPNPNDDDPTENFVGDCRPLKNFFEQYFRHINPYVWSAQDNPPWGDFNAFWWEQTDLWTLWDQKEASMSATPRPQPQFDSGDVSDPPTVRTPVTSQLLHKYPEIYQSACGYVSRGTSWSVKWTPLAPTLISHIYQPVSDSFRDHNDDETNDINSHGWIDSQILRKYPAYAWISCDRISLKRENATKKVDSKIIQIGPMEYTIRMRTGDVPTTKSASIPLDALLIPYDGESTWRYHGGNFFPGYTVSGGFLDFQAIFYSHIFNATGVRSFDFAGAPFPQNVSIGGTPILPHYCLTECIEYPLKGDTFCNPACSYIYGNKTEDPPLIRYKDSKHMLLLLRSCMTVPKSDIDMTGCPIASYGAACTACSRMEEGSLRSLLLRLFSQTGKSGTFKTDSKGTKWRSIPGLDDSIDKHLRIGTEYFWEEVYKWLVTNDSKGPFEQPDVADVMVCIATILWISHLDGKTDLLVGFPGGMEMPQFGKNQTDDLFSWMNKIDESRKRKLQGEGSPQPSTVSSSTSPGISTGLRSDDISTIGMDSSTGYGTPSAQRLKLGSSKVPRDVLYEFSPAVSDFMYLVYSRHCASFPTTLFANFTIVNAAMKNPSINNSTYRSVAFFVSEILGNLFVFGKTERVSDRILPVKFTESSTPVPATWFDQYSYIWLKGGAWGMLWAVIFLIPVYVVVRTVMVDKECRVRESFKIIGVSDSLLYLSWYSFYAIFFSIISILVTLASLSNYTHSAFLSIFILNLLHCFAIVSYALLVAASFSRMSSSTASNIAGIVYIISVLPQFAMSLEIFSHPRPLYAYLLMGLFPAAYAYGHSALLAYELPNAPGVVRPGLHLSNIGSLYSGVSLRMSYIALSVDGIIYLILAIYLDQLHPGEYGVSKPFYFPLVPQFWKELWNSSFVETHGNDHNADHFLQRVSEQPQGESDRSIEHPSLFVGKPPETRDLPKVLNSIARLPDESLVYETEDPCRRDQEVIIESIGLRKTFPKRKILNCSYGSESFDAVKRISLQIRRGEIFAILGHNGAGKTTTIGMLTGMIQPSEGKIRIMGHDMNSDPQSARRHIGFCPQHNILFDNMTVYEHLKMFATIKGLPWNRHKEEIEGLVAKLRLTEKAHSLSRALSGGQKRCLSVGIALIGGSSAVFLDEPSTGMDPYTRRFLWEALREIRKERAIILTTHFMEEADFLGDRVAIMAMGEIQCVGSPYFLKSNLGNGYTISLVKSPNFSLVEESLLKALLLDSFPGCELVSNVALEIAFRVPFDSTSELPKVLSQLEDDLQRFGIKTISVGMTTLEEVYLRVEVERITAKSEHDKEGKDQNGQEGQILVDVRASLRKEQLNESATMNHELEAGMPHGHEVKSFSIAKSNKSDEFNFISGGSGRKLGDTPALPDIEQPRGIFSDSNDDLFKQAQRYARRCGRLMEFLWHMRALLIKRLRISIRDPVFIICQFILPICFFLTFFIITERLLAPATPLALLDGDIYSTSETIRLAPNTVVVGSAPTPVSMTSYKRLPLLDPHASAAIIEKCRTLNHLRMVRVHPESSSAVELFERQLLNSWGGWNNNSLPQPIASEFPRFLAMYFDDSISEDYRLTDFVNRSNRSSVYGSHLSFWDQMQSPPALSEGWLFHNSSHRDSLATVFNLYVNCLLQHYYPGTPIFKVANQPLPTTSTLSQAALFIAMGVSTIAATWGHWTVKERMTRSKFAQHLQGVGVLTYWISNYCWDFLTFIPPAFIIFGLLGLCGVDDLVSAESKGVFLSLLFMFGAATAPFAYLLCFPLTSPVAAQGILVFLGLMMPVLCATIRLLPATNLVYESYIQFITMLFPSVAFMTGLYNVSTFNFKKEDPQSKWENVKLPAIYLCVGAIGYFCLVVFLDFLRVRPCFYRRMEQLKSLLCCRRWEGNSYNNDTLNKAGERNREELRPCSLVDMEKKKAPPVVEIPLFPGTASSTPLRSTASMMTKYPNDENCGGSWIQWHKNSKRQEEYSYGHDQTRDKIDRDDSDANDLYLESIGRDWNRMSSVRQRRCTTENYVTSNALEGNGMMTLQLAGNLPINRATRRTSNQETHVIDYSRLVTPSVLSPMLACPTGTSGKDTISEDEDVLEERMRLEENERRQGLSSNEGLLPPKKNSWFGSIFWKENRKKNEVEKKAESNNNLLIVKGLRKVFKPTTKKQREPKVAVRNLWFAVPKGQCFGFLGVNGAGKTTTIQMLTGALCPTSGSAEIAGYDVILETADACNSIGYCSQFDTLIDELTARDHIYLYGRLRLIPDKVLKPFAQELIEKLGIKEFADHPVKNYSGGTRRKLSLGLAYIGDAEAIFLDEPSSGLDPASRRRMWKFISATQQAGRAIILTTHSMDECEALCDRIGIMQAGRLVCLGTPSHLKSKFGEGYQFEVTLAAPSRTLTDVSGGQLHGEAFDLKVNDMLERFASHYVESRFPGSVLLETVGFHQRWQIPKLSTTISGIFAFGEKCKNEGVIRDYEIRETTLEQIFVNFSKADPDVTVK